MRCEDRSRSTALFMPVQKRYKRVFRNQRRVATSNKQRALFILQQCFRLQDSMPCSELFFLHHRFCFIAQIFLYHFAAETDYDNLPPCTSCFYGPQDLFYHRHPADSVQNFGKTGLHSRPLACCQDKCNRVFHSALASLVLNNFTMSF